MSRSLNMSAGNDNAIIWLVKITDGTNTYKFATESITLSTNAWDGEALAINENRFSIGEIGKRINIIEGGTIGEPATTGFGIARYKSNALINSFFDEYYPATSGKLLVGQKVEIGIIWNTATLESEITWLYDYNIEDYGYNPSLINITCTEFSEFENNNLPFYKIQKDTDNGVSYFLSAPEDNYGLFLPFVYGDFTQWKALGVPDEDEYWQLAPTVCVNETKLDFVIATHQCKALFAGANDTLFKWVDNAETFMVIQPSDGAATNRVYLTKIELYQAVRTPSTRILGDIILRPTVIGGESEVSDIYNAIDNSYVTYFELSNAAGSSLAAFKIDSNISYGDLGMLGPGNADIQLIVYWTCDAAANRDIRLRYFHPGLAVPAYSAGAGVATETSADVYPTFESTILSMGDYTGTKIDAILPWTIDELLSLEFVVENLTAYTSGEKIYIHDCHIHLGNILVSQIAPKIKIPYPKGFPGGTGKGRRGRYVLE